MDQESEYFSANQGIKLSLKIIVLKPPLMCSLKLSAQENLKPTRKGNYGIIFQVPSLLDGTIFKLSKNAKMMILFIATFTSAV